MEPIPANSESAPCHLRSAGLVLPAEAIARYKYFISRSQSSWESCSNIREISLSGTAAITFATFSADWVWKEKRKKTRTQEQDTERMERDRATGGSGRPAWQWDPTLLNKQGKRQMMWKLSAPSLPSLSQVLPDLSSVLSLFPLLLLSFLWPILSYLIPSSVPRLLELMCTQ